MNQPIIVTRNSGKVAVDEDAQIEEKKKRRDISVRPAKLNTIPESITNNQALNESIKLLPINYNFEIHKTIFRIQKEKVTTIALQFPEGLLMYSLVITDIFRNFCQVEVIVLGDVTYGACCIDDFTAKKLGAQMIIHYGHSCLVPINITTIITMYVFVEIYFDPSHLVACMRSLRDSHYAVPTSIEETGKNSPSIGKRLQRVALLGTVQFIATLHLVQETLMKEAIFEQVKIPQVKPLSAGETLGCTSPIISDVECFVFVADGRFHLEAAMIRNPTLAAYRYDPYSKVMSLEQYDTETMKKVRMESIQRARSARKFGLILGSLGRQGSLTKFNKLRTLLKDRGRQLTPFIMAELNPTKMNSIPKEQVEVWVQVACPRLSIDWSAGFDRPILTPYELEVCLQEKAWEDVYPMDYYAK